MNCLIDTQIPDKEVNYMMIRLYPGLELSQFRGLTAKKWEQVHSGTKDSVQLLSCVRLFVTPWTAVCQTSLSITNSWRLLKLMSINSVMTSNHLILCHPLLLLPSIIPSIRVFSSESVLHIRWPKYWSFASASELPMNI